MVPCSLWTDTHMYLIQHIHICMETGRYPSWVNKNSCKPWSHCASLSLSHTHTWGVRTISRPSHALPMQRYLLAVGVITGHGGLFLCQKTPCQEMTDNSAQQWLPAHSSNTCRTWASWGKDGNMCTYIIQESTGLLCLPLFPNDMYIYDPLALKG